MYYFYYNQLKNVLGEYIDFLRDVRGFGCRGIVTYIMKRWGYIYPELTFEDWLGIYNEYELYERGVLPVNYSRIPASECAYFDRIIRKDLQKKIDSFAEAYGGDDDVASSL